MECSCEPTTAALRPGASCNGDVARNKSRQLRLARGSALSTALYSYTSEEVPDTARPKMLDVKKDSGRPAGSGAPPNCLVMYVGSLDPARPKSVRSRAMRRGGGCRHVGPGPFLKP